MKTEQEIIRQAMSILGSKKTKKKAKSSAENLALARKIKAQKEIKSIDKNMAINIA